jgi:ABC-2 type transport system permease protein
MIWAILRAQILSLRLRAGSRAAGTIFGALTGLIFYSFWTLFAIGISMYFSSPDLTGTFLPVLSTGLLFAMLYWQLAPIITAGFGASIDLRKLQLYPIPHRKLFAVELLLRLISSGEMLILLAGATVGLMRNPREAGGVKGLVALAAVLFAAANLLLSAGTRHWIERLFRRTRMKEAAMVLLVVLVLLPQLLLASNFRKGTLLCFAPSQIVWPWGAGAHLMVGDSIAASVSISLLWLALAFWFGHRQFERSFREDFAGAARHEEPDAKPAGFRDLLYRMPSRFLKDPLAALVEKELRTLFRIPRFRMVYAMSGLFGLIPFLPSLRSPRTVPSFWMQNALPIMCLYGLLVLGPISYWNAFGFDRSAVQGYFSWPIRFRDALVAKNIAVSLLLIPQIAMIALAGRMLRLPITPGRFAETVLVILIAALYWFSMGNILSVRLPRAMDPDKMNQMSGKMQALSIWIAPFLLIPIVLAYWARAVFDNELVFAGILLIAAVVGKIFYDIGLDSAVKTAHLRREAMLMELSRSEGPLSVT